MTIEEVKVGDILRVIYHGAPTSLMQVTKVNKHSIEGLDGEHRCKITKVSETDFRFYVELGPNRQTVLRNIRFIAEQRLTC